MPSLLVIGATKTLPSTPWLEVLSAPFAFGFLGHRPNTPPIVENNRSKKCIFYQSQSYHNRLRD
jgi:hypothetical protein